MQFFAENPLTISVIDKIKVINKFEVADSKSDFGEHGKALVSEIFALYLNKNDIHFAISSNISAKNNLIEIYHFNVCHSYSNK